MFKGFSTRVKFPLKDGVDILAFGRVSVYEARGNYSLYVENMEPLGAGALQRAFEQLRDQLKAEGLFDPRRKKQIPRLPRHVAIVTSKTGAAIRDILNILSRRAPHIQVTVIDALVQGEAAAPSIIEGLRKAENWQSLATLPGESFWRQLQQRVGDTQELTQVAISNQAAFTSGLQEAIETWQKAVSETVGGVGSAQPIRDIFKQWANLWPVPGVKTSEKSAGA